MMGSCHLLVAAVLLLVVAVREGLSLKCVECNSFVKTDCDSNPLSHTVECPKNTTSCRKMEQEIYYDDDYHVRTIRQCAIESGPMKCIERTGTYRIKIFYCHCDRDNCNSAGHLSISVLLASVCGLLAYLLHL
ncbi:UPAR/Ly6 domain-containing protein crok-like [Babylonia areolata]|uniref:UPAR/Ly6 domain-containing protein crok-like n=1 Tax=Babylonia areolata TaxID=304850 RepID=UPI003FD5458F